MDSLRSGSSSLLTANDFIINDCFALLWVILSATRLGMKLLCNKETGDGLCVLGKIDELVNNLRPALIGFLHEIKLDKILQQ